MAFRAYRVGEVIGTHLAYAVIAWALVWGLYGVVWVLRAL